MFRKFVIAVITAMAAILEAAADAIAATLPPPPAADGPRLRVVASGRLCRRLLIMSPPPCQARAPGQQRPSRALMADPVPAARVYREDRVETITIDLGSAGRPSMAGTMATRAGIMAHEPGRT